MSSELQLSFTTRGGADPTGKPKVYFTCHPEDFGRYFDEVCGDILKSQDCAIYYTEDMTAPLTHENNQTDLEKMNLFVVPVTYRLLSQPNRAMDWDIQFAKRKDIPILPLMMESGIEEFYSKPDKFGERQFLSPHAQDQTMIEYDKKLEQYLSSALISDELMRRIRKAFDAYIFLSYRKKDRGYANELMRRIHEDPTCRDIAVWYDEFLTPGESFKANIQRMLQGSKLFTLLVTPNLVNETNYVMMEEYPAARAAGKEILPIEAEETDREELEMKYLGIPSCLQMEDAAFRERFAETLRRCAILENDNDPEHNYLIGLAYLNGIDVERNSERGMELITGAAEAGNPEAMRELYRIYNKKGDYANANRWAQAYADYCVKIFGEEHPDTLTALNILTVTFLDLGDCVKAKELQEKVYTLRCKVLGEEHPDTLIALSNLAAPYWNLGDYGKAKELLGKAYNLCCKVLGKEHPNTLSILNNLASTYSHLGEYGKAKELQEKVYALLCKVLGEEHPRTLTVLYNLAISFGHMSDYAKSKELNDEVYTLRCEVLGEEHPDTLKALGNLACTYSDLDDYAKSKELYEKAYDLRCKALGEEHSDTLTELNFLAAIYSKLGDYAKAKELYEKFYELRCKVLGEEHPKTLTALSNLACTYSDLGDYDKAKELLEKAYALHCKVLGEEHSRTLTVLDNLKALNNLAVGSSVLDDYTKDEEMWEELYVLFREVLGEEHPKTLTALNNLACTYSDLGDYARAKELYEKVYELYCKVLGEEHPNTLNTVKKLTEIYERIGTAGQ